MDRSLGLESRRSDPGAKVGNRTDRPVDLEGTWILHRSDNVHLGGVGSEETGGSV